MSKRHINPLRDFCISKTSNSHLMFYCFPVFSLSLLLVAGGLELGELWGPFQPKQFYDSMNVLKEQESLSFQAHYSRKSAASAFRLSNTPPDLPSKGTVVFKLEKVFIEHYLYSNDCLLRRFCGPPEANGRSNRLLANGFWSLVLSKLPICTTKALHKSYPIRAVNRTGVLEVSTTPFISTKRAQRIIVCTAREIWGD